MKHRCECNQCIEKGLVPLTVDIVRRIAGIEAYKVWWNKRGWWQRLCEGND